jgi:hypothetical protein
MLQKLNGVKRQKCRKERYTAPAPSPIPSPDHGPGWMLITCEDRLRVDLWICNEFASRFLRIDFMESTFVGINPAITSLTVIPDAVVVVK